MDHVQTDKVLINSRAKPIKNTAADFQCSKEILYNSQGNNAARLVNNCYVNSYCNV